MRESGILSRARKLKDSRALPYGLLFFVTLVIHLLMHMYASDDYLMHNVTYGPFFTFMVNRYFGWSTRIVCDSAFLLLLKAPPILWKILDTCVFTAFAYAVSFLAADGKSLRVDWLLACFFLIYPFTDMVSAGWITTTCVYLWTCASVCFAMVPIKKLLSAPGRTLPVRFAVLGIVCSFYAGSQEQACCALLALSGLLIVRQLCLKRKVPPLLIAELIIGLLMLSLHLSSPALAIRDVEEAAVWFPDYGTLSFLTKLELGFSATLYHYLMEPNVLFLCFSALLLFVLIQRKADVKARLCAAIPLCISLTLGFSFAYEPISAAFPAFASVRGAMTQYGTCPVFGDWDTFLPLLLLIAASVCEIYALYSAFIRSEQGLFAVYVLAVGMAARWVLGFSPTVWASGNRTFILLDFAFVFLAARLFAELERTDGKKLTGFIAALSVPTVLQLIETVLRVNEIAK